MSLFLKVQPAWQDGYIELYYQHWPSPQKVQIYTYSAAQGEVQRGSDLPVTFAAGDQLGAKGDGTLEVYKNGVLIGSANVSGWPSYASGGRLGLWLDETVVDDFGGGSVVGYLPSQSDTTLRAQPKRLAGCT